MDKLRASLDHLGTLRDDWDGMGATTFAAEFLDRIYSFCGEVGIEPVVAPANDGSVLLMWRANGVEVLTFVYPNGELDAAAVTVDGKTREQELSGAADIVSLLTAA